MRNLLFGIAMFFQGADDPSCKVMMECPALFASYPPVSICNVPCSELRAMGDRNEKALGRVRADIYVTPLAAFYMPGRPVVVRVRVVLTNPGPEFYCPTVTVEWTEGGPSSSRASDCVPYENLDDTEKSRFAATFTMLYGPGEHRITARIEQNGKVISLTRTIRILG